MAQHMATPTIPVLANRYHLDAIVYSDAMVVAYQGRDQLLNRAVTVELLRPDKAKDPVYVQRMLDKARNAALANLPHVAAIYDQNAVDERPFLVMEELAGPALADLAPLSTEQAIKVIETVADMLSAALASHQMLPSINGQTIRIHPEGRIQLIDLSLEQTPADQADAVAILGRLLGMALAGTADLNRVTPLQAIADRAINRHYQSIDALLADLRQLRQRADSPTTVIPRMHPTIAIPDTATRSTSAHGTVAAPMPTEQPAPQQRRYLWGIAGAAALIALLLFGSLVFGGDDAAEPSPAASAVTGGSPAPSASSGTAPNQQGQLYVVATNRRQPLVVRTGPGQNFPRVTSLPYGTQVEVIEGPQSANGYNWVHIRAGNVDGWCISEALRKP